jgi:hypothetical protein
MKPAKKELFKNRRILLIVLACVMVASLFLLSAGMSGLRFQSDSPFALPDFNGELSAGGDSTIQIPPLVLLIFFTVLAASLLFAVSIIIRDPELRKKVIIYIIQALMVILLYALFLSILKPKQIPPALPTEVPSQEAFLGVSPQPNIVDPVLEPYTPRPSGWLTYAVTFGVVLLGALMVIWVWRRTHPPRLVLEEIAQSALDSLRMGRRWEDVVIQCYGDMSTAAFMKRGIDRPEAMTPAEFARRLEASGIPAGPVRQLTRLFEQARYGSRSSNNQEVQQAIACLTQIVSSVDRKQ